MSLRCIGAIARSQTTAFAAKTYRLLRVEPRPSAGSNQIDSR